MKYIAKIPFKFVLTFLVLFLGCFCSTVFAQRKELDIRGIVYSKNINVRLPNVLVTNEFTHASVINDNLGAFAIKAAIGDTLLFNCRNFSDQKVVITADVSVFVFMVPVINLMQVDIKDVTKKQDMADVMKGYNKQGVYNNGKTSTLGAILNPLNGLYDLFGSGPKNARRFKEYAARESEQTEIDKRFNKPFVKKMSGIQDSVKLQWFMTTYRPDIEQIRKWTDYDLIDYIRKSYKEFVDAGEKPPVFLPKLDKDQ
ncbi:hypothetical protein BEL04_19235 [Mucilaginibacter sp. PPCGB 2223]|uniref:hypothetical protein n=1 Tax=Mucilaginibacter sp. PPCGB 2223 TaxID=1886027 RepID=UPI00082601FA|nr:hypothetical protein [Mucilaginibacter sp. PPCGB 2223]OCX50860.1 hypothetical protein BEL04_19235 [Mucilaginibacter sp. PPCGB 2223]